MRVNRFVRRQDGTGTRQRRSDFRDSLHGCGATQTFWISLRWLAAHNERVGSRCGFSARISGLHLVRAVIAFGKIDPPPRRAARCAVRSI
jgi:hypothetical protein